MGLYMDTFAFSGSPPSVEELQQELRARIGGLSGLEGYVVEGQRAELSCMLDPVTRPYGVALLLERGGVLIDRRTGAPISPCLPTYVDRPWVSFGLWWRFSTRVRYLLGLFQRPSVVYPPR